MGTVRLTERILCRQQPFRCGSVALAFSILFKCVRNRDGAVAEILAVHGLDGRVRGLERGIVNEGESLGVSGLRVSLDLGRGEDDAEGRESVVEKFLVDFRIQVSYEDVGSDVQVLLVGGGLVDADGLAVQLDHVHDFDGVVGVFFGEKLNEAVTEIGEKEYQDEPSLNYPQRQIKCRNFEFRA